LAITRKAPLICRRPSMSTDRRVKARATLTIALSSRHLQSVATLGVFRHLIQVNAGLKCRNNPYTCRRQAVAHQLADAGIHIARMALTNRKLRSDGGRFETSPDPPAFTENFSEQFRFEIPIA
jgi:hypothetical protein